MTTTNRLEQIKKEGFDINFGDVFNESFENYKKIALTAGLSFLLYSLVFGIFVGGSIGLLFGIGDFTSTMTNISTMNVSESSSILIILSTVVLTGFIAPMNAGIIKMAHCAGTDQEFSIGTTFEYYKGIYFKEIFIATIITSLVGLSFNHLFEILELKFLGTLIYYLLSFFTFLTIPLIIFGNLKSIDAIKGSFLIVSKQFLILFALLIVGLITICLGIFGFCIGIFFTLPFLYSMYYVIYVSIIDMEESSEIDEIGTFEI